MSSTTFTSASESRSAALQALQERLSENRFHQRIYINKYQVLHNLLHLEQKDFHSGNRTSPDGHSDLIKLSELSMGAYKKQFGELRDKEKILKREVWIRTSPGIKFWKLMMSAD